MEYTDCWYQTVCKRYSRSLMNCKACPKFVEMHSLMRQSHLPESKWKPQNLVPFGNEEAHNTLVQIKGDVDNWVKGGGNLYLFSKTCGTGKTSWAVKLLQSYFDKVWAGNGLECRGLFVSVPNFLVRCKDTIRATDESLAELKAKLPEVDLVVWDDIAVTKLTEYEHSLLFAYIDSRMLTGRSNIFTGNANRAVMYEYLGERLTSRIYHGSTVLEFTNRDMRGVRI